MGEGNLTIRKVTARAVAAPLRRPIRPAVGTIPNAPLVLIDIATEQGIDGCAYLFGYMPATLIPLVRFIETIGETLIGKPVAPVALLAEFDRSFRLLGWEGDGRHGGRRPRHGVLGRTGQGGGLASGPAPGRRSRTAQGLRQLRHYRSARG